jgi:hypothetical protein
MARTVAVAFDELLADLALTPRQKEVAQGRLNHLRSYFTTANIACADLPFAIGSYARGTVIRRRRDIDALVALSYATYEDRYDNDPDGMLRWLRDNLNREYGDTTVTRSGVAIRMKLGEDLQVDLVPSFRRQGGGFLMPNGRGGWQATNPPFHDQLITDANARTGSALKPLVRVMKAWNVSGNGARLGSFHLEMLVERMWRKATELPSLPAAVTATLKAGGGWVRDTFPDPWTASAQNLDAYLSADARAQSARTMDEDAVRAQDALDYAAAGKTEKAFERWGVVFGHDFPAYG